MENIEKTNKENVLNNNVGFILWKLEQIDNFLPCFKSIMKKE
jgi:hypothetical protein